MAQDFGPPQAITASGDHSNVDLAVESDLHEKLSQEAGGFNMEEIKDDASKTGVCLLRGTMLRVPPRWRWSFKERIRKD